MSEVPLHRMPGVRLPEHARRRPTPEATQGQFDGFCIQLPYKFCQNRAASVGDGLEICPWILSRVVFSLRVFFCAPDSYRCADGEWYLQGLPTTSCQPRGYPSCSIPPIINSIFRPPDLASRVFLRWTPGRVLMMALAGTLGR